MSTKPQTSQPKTLQEYRDLTKILKLKIVKQSKIIQQLENKCKKYEEEINNATYRMTSRQEINLMNTKGYEEIGDIKEQELGNLKGKSDVMRKFLKGAKMFGITPESIYRIADFGYTNCIESDYFRTILSKMSLNLTPKQLSCLIFIFDQICSGYISKQDFDNTLQAYEIGIQQNCLPYTQQCLLKLCSLFHAEKVDLNKFYDQMKNQAKQKNSGYVDLIIFQNQVKNYFNGKLQQRQIIGAYNQINLQKQKSIQKKNFLYGINSFTNRLFSQDRSKVQISSQYPGNSNLKNSRSQLRIPNTNQNTNKNSHLTIGNATSGLFKGVTYAGQQPAVIKMLKQRNLQFQDIVTSMINIPLKSRMSIHHFKKCIEKVSKQLSSQDISLIFKSLDQNQQGSIHIFDVINYCLKHLKDTNLVFKLIGKSLQIFQTTAQQFWKSQQFEDLSRIITKNKFIQIMGKTFQTQNPQIWDLVWGYFDKGKGTIIVQSIVDVWRKYEVV